jgi:hypothetical protein
MRLPALPRHAGPLVEAIAVIGVGVGLAAMLFALADAYVWKPLPYAEPERLVSIGFDMMSGPPGQWNRVTQADIPSLASWQARTDLFDGVAAFDDRGWARVQLSDRIVPLRLVAVSDNLFRVLGVGSRWIEADTSEAWVSPHVATALSGGELAPGRSATMPPDAVLRVQHVLPRSFLLPEANRTLPVDALVMLPPGPVLEKDGASTRTLDIAARARPGVTPQIIEAALSATLPAGRRVSVTPLQDAMTGQMHGLALGAMLAAGLIVLVCWTNVFNIALTRGLYRVQELATRAALGATPARIVDLLAREAIEVATLGSAIALGVASLALAAAALVLPPRFTTLGVPSVTMRVVMGIAIAGAVAGASWCVASILAWRLGVRRQSRQVVGRDGRAIRAVRFAVVAGQLAAASVLLAGAALLGRSYLNLVGVDPGMDERAETLTVAHDPNIPVSVRRETIERTMTALRRVEGVQAVGASRRDLLDGPPSVMALSAAGRHVQVVIADWMSVVGHYFDAAGMQFLAGRPPDPDQAGAVVINETMAQKYFGGHVPDQLVLIDGTTRPIAGVVRDVRVRSLGTTPGLEAYEVGGDTAWSGSQPLATYVLRVTAGTSGLAAWERAVRSADPLALVLDSGTIGDRLGRSIRGRTFASLVVGLFALAAIVVTTLGLAGIVAYTVVKRTREIAIRLALGATGPGVTRLIVGDTLLAGALGVVAGIVASVWLSKSLTSLLYGVPPADPSTLVLTGVSLPAIVLGAAVLPAIRAAHVEPATALRIE